MDNRAQRFFAKKEAQTFYLPLCIFIAAAIIFLITCLQGQSFPLYVPLFFLIGYAFLAWLWLRIFYDFYPDYLIVACGPVRERYFYADITCVRRIEEPRRVLLFFYRRFRAFCAAPPKPRKRIALYYGGHLRGYVAPKQEREFLRELKKRCKNARFIPEETD